MGTNLKCLELSCIVGQKESSRAHWKWSDSVSSFLYYLYLS